MSSFRNADKKHYAPAYFSGITQFQKLQQQVLQKIQHADGATEEGREEIKSSIREARLGLKAIDFWLRYLEPIAYKKINGPLPVEWETEVFEKFEAPYRREGAGLTLAQIYIEEDDLSMDSLAQLIQASLEITEVFQSDSITRQLDGFHHLFLANRLYLLNLAAIYTTGFECPDTASILPELRHMMKAVKEIYLDFNRDFPHQRLNAAYLDLYEKAVDYLSLVNRYADYDHFHFIKNFIDPLYMMNAAMIRSYEVRSVNYADYSLNREANSIFDRDLYRGQNGMGVYLALEDNRSLEELEAVGRQLFFDPLLSGNNRRSCASCHNPAQFFADTTVASNLQYDGVSFLQRNTPSLVNVADHHLLMLDGKHYSLERQIAAVITNEKEMGGDEDDVIKKVMSCNDYRTVFKKHLKATPRFESVTLEHIASAISIYITRVGKHDAPFDKAIKGEIEVDETMRRGFNLFMGRAQCGTCHFVPRFNGVKPPYTNSEFEVIGVPTTAGNELSADSGRYKVHDAAQSLHAFRTNTVRNAAVTSPYMHNGALRTLEEVIDFYDRGGGAGRGFRIDHQTLSSDSLKLSADDKAQLLYFIRSLTETAPVAEHPLQLPSSKKKSLSSRRIGGDY